MFSVSKLLGGMRVGQRLLVAFSTVIVILAVAIGFNLVSSSRNRATVEEVLGVQANIAEHSARARANTADLRRYEKDIFLNVASAKSVTEYEAKWAEQQKSLTARLDDLDKYVSSAEDRAAVATMRKNLTTYETGLREVLGSIRAGNIKDPAAANEAIGPYKDEIRSLEQVTKDLATKYNEVMDKSGDEVTARAGTAAVFTVTTSAIAVIVAALVAFMLAGSITRPLRSAVAGAQEVAQGRFQINATEELAQMTQAFDGVKGLLVETRQLKDKVEQDNRELQADIMHMLQVVSEASDGDLTVRATTSAGALGNVADAFNQLLESLGSLVRDIDSQLVRTNTTVEEIQKAAQKMASGATSQTHEVQSATGLVEQMAGRITSVSQLADNAAEAARRTKDSAQDGANAVQNAVSGMLTLRQNVQAIEQQTHIVEEESAVVSSAGDSLSKIRDVSNESFGLVTNIRGTTAEQVERTRKVVETMAQISSIARATQAGAERSAESIGKLMADSTRLVQAVRKFKVA